jgi:hypothetical protein
MLYFSNQHGGSFFTLYLPLGGYNLQDYGNGAYVCTLLFIHDTPWTIVGLLAVWVGLLAVQVALIAVWVKLLKPGWTKLRLLVVLVGLYSDCQQSKSDMGSYDVMTTTMALWSEFWSQTSKRQWALLLNQTQRDLLHSQEQITCVHLVALNIICSLTLHWYKWLQL